MKQEDQRDPEKRAVSRYSFAWITELDIPPDNVVKAMEQLEEWTSRLQGKNDEKSAHDEYDHRLLMASGTTGLIEFSFFNHVYHFFEVAQCTSYSARKSVGARCLAKEELALLDIETPYYEILSIENCLSRKAEGCFVATVYVRLSTIARLCVPAEYRKAEGSSGESLLDSFFSRFFNEDASVWKVYEKILVDNGLSGKVWDKSRKVSITPLTALDSVDCVFVLRASRLEQIVALAWALRVQKLAAVWSAGELSVDLALTAAANLLGSTLGEISGVWGRSPLLNEIRYVWGIPVYSNPGPKGGDRWSLESPKDSEQVAARVGAAMMFSRSTPGRFSGSMRSSGIARSLEEGPVAKPSEGSSLNLSDRYDFLFPGPTMDSLRTVKTADIVSHFDRLKSKAPDGGPGQALWPTTEFAVSMVVPEENSSEIEDLAGRFRQLLRNRHENDFSRIGSLSVTRSWLDAAQDSGLSYSITNAVVNMMSSFMTHLQRDPEGFYEILPALRKLVEMIRERSMSQHDLSWLVARIKKSFIFLAQQYYPLQSPYSSSSLEGHVGFKLARDAFVGYTRTLAAAMVPGYEVLVLDYTDGSLVCENGPCKFICFNTSPFVLHYPIYWTVATDLAYSRLAGTAHGALAVKQAYHLQNLANALGSFYFNEGDSVRDSLSQMGSVINRSVPHSVSKAFTFPFKRVLGDTLADFALWRTITLKKDSFERQASKFWCVRGPGLIVAIRDDCGGVPPGLSLINYLVLRVFFLNYLVHRLYHSKELEAQRMGDWVGTLLEVVDGLLKDDFSFAGTEEDTSALDFVQQTCVYLLCLKLDLRMPQTKWITALHILRDGLMYMRRGSFMTITFVESWLKVIEPLVDEWLLVDFSESRITQVYSEYLGELIDGWGTADPWPPFIEHAKEVDDEQPETLTAGIMRLRGDRPYQGFLGLRGGVFVRDSGDQNDGQKKYHQMTGRLMKVVADHSRDICYTEISKLI